jgi:hypothetical protein
MATRPLRPSGGDETLTRFLSAGRPTPKQPEPKDKMLTLPELEELLRTKKKLPDAAQTH